MANYDTHEAIGNLARAHATNSPKAFESDLESAARELVDAVVSAAEAAHYRTSVHPDGYSVIQSPSNDTIKIALKPQRDGVMVSLQQTGGLGARPIAAPEIEYDYAARKWVGKALDTSVIPIPGQPNPKRSAVAAVADRVLEAIASMP